MFTQVQLYSKAINVFDAVKADNNELAKELSAELRAEVEKAGRLTAIDAEWDQVNIQIINGKIRYTQFGWGSSENDSLIIDIDDSQDLISVDMEWFDWLTSKQEIDEEV